jgi:hypothetical protein
VAALPEDLPRAAEAAPAAPVLKQFACGVCGKMWVGPAGDLGACPNCRNSDPARIRVHPYVESRSFSLRIVDPVADRKRRILMRAQQIRRHRLGGGSLGGGGC